MRQYLEIAFGLISFAIIALIVQNWQLALLFVGLGFVYALYRQWYNNETNQELRSRKHTWRLYEDVKQLVPPPADREAFAEKIALATPKSASADVDVYLLKASLDLFNAEHLVSELPEPPAICNSIEGARYRDFLSDHASKISQAPRLVAVMEETITEAFTEFISQIPKPTTEGREFASVLLRDLIEVRPAIESLILPFYSQQALKLNLFAALRLQLDANLHKLSGVPLSAQTRTSNKLIMPEDYEGENPEYAYLRDTPFLDIFNAHVPLMVPADIRFEHTWMCATTGHGKTQSFQSMILDDLELVKAGKASLIVIDSQQQLISKISHLKLFAPGEPLHERLILVDPNDTGYPVACNVFDVDFNRSSRLSDEDHERITNGIISAYEYFLRSLLGAELTQRQGVIFRYLALTFPHDVYH